jgi:hypothetical protein
MSDPRLEQIADDVITRWLADDGMLSRESRSALHFLIVEALRRVGESAQATGRAETPHETRARVTGCPHDGNCGCAIGSQHFWYNAFCEQRAKLAEGRDESAARIAELEAELERDCYHCGAPGTKRGAPTPEKLLEGR